ncbi:MAG: hypothetical protein H6550_16305 [Chitinophagales bacterium]|nr:hypothetical protein [Chitinophagales bacterium]
MNAITLFNNGIHPDNIGILLSAEAYETLTVRQDEFMPVYTNGVTTCNTPIEDITILAGYKCIYPFKYPADAMHYATKVLSDTPVYVHDQPLAVVINGVLAHIGINTHFIHAITGNHIYVLSMSGKKVKLLMLGGNNKEVEYTIAVDSLNTYIANNLYTLAPTMEIEL